MTINLLERRATILEQQLKDLQKKPVAKAGSKRRASDPPRAPEPLAAEVVEGDGGEEDPAEVVGRDLGMEDGDGDAAAVVAAVAAGGDGEEEVPPSSGKRVRKKRVVD